jgi:hypothetical protein
MRLTCSASNASSTAPRSNRAEIGQFRPLDVCAEIVNNKAASARCTDRPLASKPSTLSFQSNRMTPIRDLPLRCPCCGFKTLSERGGYEICDVCFWEDDGQDDDDADEVLGGPNGDLSLTEGRANYRAFGASRTGPSPRSVTIASRGARYGLAYHCSEARAKVQENSFSGHFLSLSTTAQGRFRPVGSAKHNNFGANIDQSHELCRSATANVARLGVSLCLCNAPSRWPPGPTAYPPASSAAHPYSPRPSYAHPDAAQQPAAASR